MGRYSIKELEKLSGIKAHTIRIWEKRHKIILPERTDTNIRFYSDDDLKKIINVSLLNNNGIKISKIADLTDAELNQQVKALSDAQTDPEIHIDQLVVAMVDLDEENFEHILNGFILRYGFEHSITEIIYPFLDKIGVLWQTGNVTPAQEHFISNLIRQKLIAAIDALPLPPRGKPVALLFLPDHELHELGLLFHYYVIKKSGLRTYYLGQMVPYRDLIEICKTHRPTYLITSITSSQGAGELQAYLDKLCSEMHHSRVLISGYAVRKTALKMPSNLHVFSRSAELKALLGVK
ncbi:MAG: MerR family transcriptional regulator [Cyclobacteriaceae bacterium]|jgi:DNA-binding transcriptional MerR regulator|nr:helix-turn-helix-type transcriptional regulator [Cytophagales bacterium]HNP76772.1 MerR family transcriptional regulator [Cyclobacteriaceae bacterium]